MTVKYIQTQATSTTYGISNVSTTIQLKKLLKLDGTSISASDIGDLLYGTFAPGTSREEIFSIVGANVTIETNGNVSITNVVRGLKEVSPYTTGGYSCDHPAGEVVVFGNNPQVYQYLKDYIDAAIINGAVPATDAIPGISMEATVADIDADTESRTYNSISYKLFINPAKLILSKFGLRLPTADQKAALVGTQGVPSSTNKYVTLDNVYTSDTDQTQTTQNATIEFGMASTTGNKNTVSQSFIPVKTKIRGVKLYKIADTGTFTGTTTFELLADSAGSPTGVALATVTISNANWLSLPVGEFEADFSAEYSMVAGTLYWIRASASTADSSNHPNLGTNSAGGYANGSVKYYNATDGYVAVANIDLYFKTLQGTSGQILAINTSPTVQVFTVSTTVGYGAANSQFDITNTVGSTFRYTWDGTGTDPGITALTFPVGYTVTITSGYIHLNNQGSFIITGSGANYFEVTNTAGVTELNKVLNTINGLQVQATQTYTKPAGLKYAVIEVQGGGGGGDGITGDNHAVGASAGGYVRKTLSSSSIGVIEKLVVGYGGIGTYAQSLHGGLSFFGSTLFAYGGRAPFYTIRQGGRAYGGDLNIDGGYSKNGGGDSTGAQTGGDGGNSFLGCGGYGGENDNDGGPGTGFGAGGGGAGRTSAGTSHGGTGSNGIIIINEYYY